MFIVLLLLFTTTAFATETEKSVPIRNYYEERVGYTGSDFFNGLDLPLIVGATYTPNQLQTAGFITSMCLEWRWHKTYSWYVPITIDTHNANYSQLKLPNSNILSGTVWYTEAHAFSSPEPVSTPKRKKSTVRQPAVSDDTPFPIITFPPGMCGWHPPRYRKPSPHRPSVRHRRGSAKDAAARSDRKLPSAAR